MRRTVVFAALLTAALPFPAGATNTGFAGAGTTSVAGLQAGCAFSYRGATKFGTTIELAAAAVSSARTTRTSVHCELRSESTVIASADGAADGPAAAAVEGSLIQGLQQLTICVSARNDTSVAPLRCTVPIPID